MSVNTLTSADVFGVSNSNRECIGNRHGHRHTYANRNGNAHANRDSKLHLEARCQACCMRLDRGAGRRHVRVSIRHSGWYRVDANDLLL